METTTALPINFTASAKDELKRLFDNNADKANRFLRIGVKGGGCSGLSYLLEVDNKQAEDELFTVDGIPCIVNPAHSIYLFGMEVDWKNGLDARGFIFNNPNASSTCGCGTSFAV